MRVRFTSAGLFVLPRAANDGPPPHHISADNIAKLPAVPGIYIFRGRRRQPLYVGKSVDIRSRVRSHLNNAEQAALLAESRSIDFIETAGEIGALLQEAHLVRRWQPRYNRLLLDPGEPWVVASARASLTLSVLRATDAADAGLRAHALFSSRARAEQALRELVRHAQLCPGLTGLETLITGRGCFARQLGQCRGACIGREPLAAYRRRRNRALAALQTNGWPYGGPIGIVERRAGISQIHVIDRWCYRGSISGVDEQIPLPAGGFDGDVYRIVARRLQRNELEWVSLAMPGQRD